ncbi:Hsp20/alpha crystallin family protein [Peribacillus glennii]|uniref:Hsp20/alpha crystallin family protein n=1 Tax=Peribacillus glennii TaxID=2303991 RepID=A0A372L6B2_9BACI|nr:Hsp20/alpha crystallin family protein [Peribacillus glennii]RFU60540.1 Hsp20/alpha crystallin family protein [Peribacillus glennii]
MSEDSQKDKNADSDRFDKFMENYFLDPNTGYLDQLTFRVDIYECNEEYVIEALFDDRQPKRITLQPNGQELSITAFFLKKTHPETINPVERTVPFPFSITNKKISAAYGNSILEIRISKEMDNDATGKGWSIFCT